MDLLKQRDLLKEFKEHLTQVSASGLGYSINATGWSLLSELERSLDLLIQMSPFNVGDLVKLTEDIDIKRRSGWYTYRLMLRKGVAGTITEIDTGNNGYVYAVTLPFEFQAGEDWDHIKKYIQSDVVMPEAYRAGMRGFIHLKNPGHVTFTLSAQRLEPAESLDLPEVVKEDIEIATIYLAIRKVHKEIKKQTKSIIGKPTHSAHDLI